MAVSIELNEHSDVGRVSGGTAPVTVLPALRVRRATAAGSFVLTAGAMQFVARNFGDPIYAKVCLLADNAAPSASDELSTFRAAGDDLEFMLPDDAIPTAYKLVFVVAV